MTSKPPGVLGTFTNPASAHDRALTGNGLFRSPAPAGHRGPASFQEVEHRLTELAHRFSTAIGWHDKQSAAYKLLGQHSFTAGVVWGIGENFTKTVFSAVELVEMLTLAEYWESKHNHTLMGQVRANMFMTAMPGLDLGMLAMGHFWPGFDQKAREAYEERDALIDAITYAFSHPKDLLGSLTKAQEARYKEFTAFRREKSLSGNFHAGKLMGELLFDLFMVIDLVAGLVKLVAALPKLARYAQDFARLAREFRAAKQLETKVSELAEPGPRMTQAEKDAAQARMRGSADRIPPPPPPAEPPPLAPPKSPMTREEAFQKIDEFRNKKAGMEPLGDTIPTRGDGLGTVAMVDLEGQPVFGVNSTALLNDSDKALARQWRDTMMEDYDWNGGDAQALFHGEGQALIRAYDKAGNNLPSELNMYVDRLSCANCRSKLPDLMDAMGVDKLNLFFKNGQSAAIENGQFSWLN